MNSDNRPLRTFGLKTLLVVVTLVAAFLGWREHEKQKNPLQRYLGKYVELRVTYKGAGGAPGATYHGRVTALSDRFIRIDYEDEAILARVDQDHVTLSLDNLVQISDAPEPRKSNAEVAAEQ